MASSAVSSVTAKTADFLRWLIAQLHALFRAPSTDASIAAAAADEIEIVVDCTFPAAEEAAAKAALHAAPITSVASEPEADATTPAPSTDADTDADLATDLATDDVCVLAARLIVLFRRRADLEARGNFDQLAADMAECQRINQRVQQEMEATRARAQVRSEVAEQATSRADAAAQDRPRAPGPTLPSTNQLIARQIVLFKRRDEATKQRDDARLADILAEIDMIHAVLPRASASIHPSARR